MILMLVGDRCDDKDDKDDKDEVLTIGDRRAAEHVLEHVLTQ